MQSVAIILYFENQVVDYIPYNSAPKVSAFLRRDVNKGFAAAGDRVNSGAGYGLEVPSCVEFCKLVHAC